MKNPAEQIKRVGLIANIGKRDCRSIVREAVRLLRKAGRRVFTETATAEMADMAGMKGAIYQDPAVLARHVDLLLVFGGDGTILRVARQIAGCRTPILGVNIGSLGFLTAVTATELTAALQNVWKGNFSYEPRGLIEATRRSGARLLSETALNDIVVSRGIASRLIELDVHVNDDLLTRYRCDGLIISSPTGSTAYSLAAGGAVIFPTAQVLAVTPICPHTLSNRALIVPSSATLQVQVVSVKPETILSADGRVVTTLAAGDTLTIRRSRRTIRLMHLAGSSFCDTLRRKLHWRGATL